MNKLQNQDSFKLEFWHKSLLRIRKLAIFVSKNFIKFEIINLIKIFFFIYMFSNYGPSSIKINSMNLLYAFKIGIIVLYYFFFLCKMAESFYKEIIFGRKIWS